jgi:hypothetical protein
MAFERGVPIQKGDLLVKRLVGLPGDIIQVLTQTHFEPNLIQLGCQLDANLMQIPSKFDANSMRIGCEFDANFMQIPCRRETCWSSA